MKPELKLALCGPHGSGKTTLLMFLKTSLPLLDIDYLPEITRVIQKQGFQINEAGTQDTQLLVMSTHIQNLLLHNRFIVDRCLVDGYCYTKYLYEESLKNKEDPLAISAWCMSYCESLLQAYISRYTKIFYIPTEIPLKSDGVRSVDSYFHESIIRIFDETISTLSKTNPSLFVTVSGSVKERVKIIQDTFHTLYAAKI